MKNLIGQNTALCIYCLMEETRFAHGFGLLAAPDNSYSVQNNDLAACSKSDSSCVIHNVVLTRNKA